METNNELRNILIIKYQQFTKWVLRHTPEIEQSQRGKDYLKEIDEVEAKIRKQEFDIEQPDPGKAEDESPFCICQHERIISNGYCQYCGKPYIPEVHQSNPVKEELIKVLNWITRENSPYAVLYGNISHRFATSAKDYTTEQIVDEYLKSNV